MWVESQQLQDIITGEIYKHLDTFFDPGEGDIVCLVEKENGDTIASVGSLLENFIEVRDAEGKIVL